MPGGNGNGLGRLRSQRANRGSVRAEEECALKMSVANACLAGDLVEKLEAIALAGVSRAEIDK